ncbi:hypothetical protein GQ53DRAFT_117471 [Thozetella sp. PMI_491]|nr:hypothetical protein GQ53DRAFT_117471 [Thozetella sp. PMI_491]
MTSFKETALGFVDPWLFMLFSLSFLPGTIFRLVSRGDFATLVSPSRLQAAWFGDFWAVAGPGVRTNGENNVVPLLEGRVRGGKIVDESTGHGVGGTVIEVGPGSGMWVSLFSDRYLHSEEAGAEAGGLRRRVPAGRTKVTRVLGIEPNKNVHHLLQEQIHSANLDGVYEIVPVGIESLISSGRVPPESVDCIVTILCLCSIPDPEHNIKALYKCLKPGGKWFVYEHVRCQRKGGLVMVLYQAFVNLFWPTIIGGCEICRDTGRYLRESGPWHEVDLEQPPQEPWFHTLPHIYGTLTK